MARAKPNNRNNGENTTANKEEDRGLLSRASLESNSGDEGDLVIVPGRTSFESQHKTLRTPNRVRFDLPEHDGARRSYSPPLSGRRDSHLSDEGEESFSLLTSREAPTVALANRLSDDGTDVHTYAERERLRPKSNLQNAFMNMANSIIGAGIIGQPYAFKQAGLLTGIILLICLTVTVDWTIRLIVVNSKLSGRDSFQGTVEHCFGWWGLVGISVAQWAFAFGGMVAFGVIVGDSIPHVLTAIWPGLSEVPVLGVLAGRHGVIVVFILGVSWPLSLYRDIAKLAKASTLALISMSVILVTVVVEGILTPSDQRGSFSTPLLTINSGIFQAIGVISFAFVCHHNSLLIYGSLSTPTLDRFSKVTHYSTSISLIACLLMALAGFLTFGSKTLGNVLNNFPTDNTFVNIARLCFGLNMLTTLPLEAFVCREVMHNFFFDSKKKLSVQWHVGISTALVLGAMLLSLTTCDLGAVFELIGATSACVLAYVLPPLCFIKLSTRSWKTVPAVACVVFGCVVFVISLMQAIGKMISGSGEAKVCT